MSDERFNAIEKTLDEHTKTWITASTELKSTSRS